jgi:hypothetical protein
MISFATIDYVSVINEHQGQLLMWNTRRTFGKRVLHWSTPSHSGLYLTWHETVKNTSIINPYKDMPTIATSPK